MILIDPPWPQVTWTSKEAKYGLMTMAGIAKLPVSDLAEKDAHVFLWCTVGTIEDAFPLIRHWGFDLRTVIVWDKRGGRTSALGHGIRLDTEFVVVGRRGKVRFNNEQPKPNNIITHARMGHSQKPDAFYELIEHLTEGPYLEMFARRPREGWDSMGDETISVDEWRPGKREWE